MRRVCFFIFCLTLCSTLLASDFRHEENSLVFDKFTLTFERTLRIPDDGKTYPLPPSLGNFPLYSVKSYAKKLPKGWKTENAYFIPMYQREAMWISFKGEEWRPRAVKIGVGKVNIVTGEKWVPELKKGEQDYLVAPAPQMWVDGIKTGKNKIRQFVATPLGKGFTVEGQITGKEDVGGIQIVVFNPKKGKFKKPLFQKYPRSPSGNLMMNMVEEKSMGLGAGGTMEQKFYPDPHGLDTWDTAKFGVATVYIVNSAMFKQITGKNPPETPISKKEYEAAGYPWFGLYDEKYSDLPAKSKLAKIKSIPKNPKKEDEKSMTVKKTIKYEMPKKSNP